MKLGNDINGELDGSLKITDISELSVIISALIAYNENFDSEIAEKLAVSFSNILTTLLNNSK